MNKFIRSYPNTNDWKARTYKKVKTSHIVAGVIVVIAVILQLNSVL